MSPKHIEKAAKKRGVKMSAILRKANVNHSTWWRWKHGKHSPLMKTVTRILDAVKGGEA
jgi:hypothetical protein